MSIIDHRIKHILHHFRDSGRLNVLIALISHANVRNRCYPSMRLIAKETGYALEAVNEAKKWLEEHGAIEMVKYQQRVGDERRIKSVRQNVYQLTGVINIDGVEHPYLYVSPSEISNTETLPSEISTVEMEVVKSVKSVKKGKDSNEREEETTFAPADANAGHPDDLLIDADKMALPSIGAQQKPARAKPAKREAIDFPPSKQSVPPTDATDNPLPKGSAQKVSPAQAAAKARIQAMVDCGFADPITKRDFSSFNEVLKTLGEAGIDPTMYADYVAWTRDESKRGTGWPVTLRSLISSQRPSEYMAQIRAGKRLISTQSPTQVGSMLAPRKNAYNPFNDPAYVQQETSK